MPIYLRSFYIKALQDVRKKENEAMEGDKNKRPRIEKPPTVK